MAFRSGGRLGGRERLVQLAFPGRHGAAPTAIVHVGPDPLIAQRHGSVASATRERIEAEGGEPALAGATAFALVWMVERSFYQQLVQREPVDMDELVDAMGTIFERTVSA